MTRCRYCTAQTVANGRCAKHQEPPSEDIGATTRAELSRRLRLVVLLRQPRTIAELAGIFAVSGRTVQRDLVLLRRIGLPLAARAGEYGRKTWRIPKWVEAVKNFGEAPKE